jgi:hypothetical protein
MEVDSGLAILDLLCGHLACSLIIWIRALILTNAVVVSWMKNRHLVQMRLRLAAARKARLTNMCSADHFQ